MSDAVATHVDSQQVLADLGLQPDDQAALSRQGFVVAEFRRRNGHRWGPYYKLRWRRGDRQCVQYLGHDAAYARQVSEALAEMQSSLRLTREAARITKQAWRSLREAKRMLEPQMAARGRHFHGDAIRRATLTKRVFDSKQATIESGDNFLTSLTSQCQEGTSHEREIDVIGGSGAANGAELQSANSGRNRIAARRRAAGSDSQVSTRGNGTA